MKNNRFSFSKSSRRELLRAGMYGVCVTAGASIPVPVFGQAAAQLASQAKADGKILVAEYSAGDDIVVLDPGHNLNNSSSINQIVNAGNGVFKACDTTGTATNGGYPEHAFTWDVANRAAARRVRSSPPPSSRSSTSVHRT